METLSWKSALERSSPLKQQCHHCDDRERKNWPDSIQTLPHLSKREKHVTKILDWEVRPPTRRRVRDVFEQNRGQPPIMRKGSQFRKPKTSKLKANGQKGRDNPRKNPKNSHDITENIITKKFQYRLPTERKTWKNNVNISCWKSKSQKDILETKRSN